VHSPVAGASAKHAATNACQLSDGTGVTAKTASMNTFETVSNNSDKERDVRKNLPRRFEKAMISILFSAFNLCTTRRINLLKHQHQTESPLILTLCVLLSYPNARPIRSLSIVRLESVRGPSRPPRRDLFVNSARGF